MRNDLPMNAAELSVAIVENSDAAIVAKDLDGNVLAWNKAAERVFGWTSAEMIGQPIGRIIPGTRQDEENEIMASIRRGESIDRLETVRLHKDGSLIDIAVLVSPIRDASGAVVGASKIARAITEELRTRKALQEAETRFALMADNIAQLAWIADGEGSIYWYNRRWVEYTGLTAEDMAAAEAGRKVVHPDHFDRVSERYREQFDFAPDGYFVTDLSGRIQEANVAAAVILHTEQEFLVYAEIRDADGEIVARATVCWRLGPV